MDFRCSGPVRNQFFVLSTKLVTWSPNWVECVEICHVTNQAMAPSAATPKSRASAAGSDFGPGRTLLSRRSRGCSTAVRNSARINEKATSSIRTKIFPSR